MAQNHFATDAVRVPPVELTARIVTLRLAETFVIARESSDEEDVVQVELRHDGVTGFGEGGADRALRRVGRVGARVSRGGGGRARRRPVRARGDRGAGCRRARTRPGRRSTAPCTTCRGSCSASRSGGCSACRGPARRRRGRSGSAIPTTWRAGRSGRRRGSRRLKLKLGGGDGLDVERVRAVRASPSCRSRST